MKLKNVLCALAAVIFLAQPAIADDDSDSDSDSDDKRFDASVSGRTYCQTRTNTQVRAHDDGRLRNTVNLIRRTAEFHEDGTLTFTSLSFRQARQDHTSQTVFWLSGPGPSFTGTYTQSGTRLDVLLDNGNQDTYFVSADGSVILGAGLSDQNFGGFRTLGVASEHLVEIDPDEGVLCQADPFPEA